ncbi:MAG: hypothetical protein H7Z37_16300 [Pyrinomonadaceae bacterium]|nr:hypothetical protein [Pyrinomonadaceae bacterium]
MSYKSFQIIKRAVMPTLMGAAFLLTAHCLPLTAKAQTVVDKMVATVNDTVNTELITYSDLLWQLALQPNVELTAPTSAELNTALQRIVEQRLIALEAGRLPNKPTEDETKAEIERIVKAFPSAAIFESRLRRVGFDSISDANFRRIIEQRVAIEKYLEFRFRSFVIIAPDDEAKFYRDVYTPEFRKNNAGVVVPTIEQARPTITAILTEDKIENDISNFLEAARERATVTILNPI